MINVSCDVCKEELQEKGGLLFGVPNKHSRAKKIHLCLECTKCVEGIIKKDSKDPPGFFYGAPDKNSNVEVTRLSPFFFAVLQVILDRCAEKIASAKIREKNKTP